MLLLVCNIAAAAQNLVPSGSSEYQVKAFYLSNFGRFLGWTGSVAGGDAPFYICILGKDPFGSALDEVLTGEKIGPSPLAAKRISNVADSQDCRLLFISSSESSRLQTILTAITTSVLTVGEMPDFARRGGMIQFVPQGKRIRFEINLAAAQRAGLNVGSQLLVVATAVRTGP